MLGLEGEAKIQKKWPEDLEMIVIPWSLGEECGALNLASFHGWIWCQVVWNVHFLEGGRCIFGSSWGVADVFLEALVFSPAHRLPKL